MERDEIIGEMDRLSDLLGKLHDQVNSLADREASRAWARMPTDHGITQSKERLVDLSAKVIERLEDLNKELVGGDA